MKEEEVLNDFRLFVIYTWEYLGLPKPTRMQLYIADYLQEQHSRMVLQALRGIGKGQPLSCKVLAKEGWTTIGELKEGQEIYGANGKLQTVEQLHPVSELDCYEFEFSDGRKTRCDIDHLWKVYHQSKWQVLTTKQILDKGITYSRSITNKNTTGIEAKFKIPLVEPIDFEEKVLPLDPYVLGYLIGDGSLTRGISFTIDNKDKEEVKQYFTNAGMSLGKERSDTRRPNVWQVGVLGINHTIKALGLNVTSEYKRIPKEYFTASIKDRVALLQGLLDSDGYCNKSFEFVSKSKGLSEDVADLARSLGAIARISKHQHGWRVYIQSNINLCRLERKASKFQASGKHKLALVKVTSLGTMSRRCITVSNNDSLYITDDYIVTHNTWITAAYVCWRLLRNPNEKVLIISQSGTHAENIAVFIKRLIRGMEILQHLQARQDQRDTTVSFDVNGCMDTVQPSVKALGITSQLQGNRATLIISDDVEGQQNSATEQMRMKLKQATAEYEAILQTDGDSQILILGTPQSAESIYKGFREDGYYTRIFPARYPDDASVYDGCLAPYIVEDMNRDSNIIGQPIDSRFTDEDLLRREARYGKSGFKLQFMLDTRLSDSERYPLKCYDLIVTDLDKHQAHTQISYSSAPQDKINVLSNIGFNGDGFYRPSTLGGELLKYEGVYMGIDPSGRGSDEMGYAIVAHLHGKLFLLEQEGLQGGYVTDNLIRIAMKAQEYKVNKIWIEDNFGDGMFSSLLKPVVNSIYPCGMEDVKQSKQKELRVIDTLEPVMNQHRLIIDKGLVERDIRKAMTDGKISYSLFYQLTHITKDRGSLVHDDNIDVLALVVGQWMRILVQNPETVYDRYKAKQIEDDINLFLKRNSAHKTSLKSKIFSGKW
ncbi:MAG: phage terminase large subunit [Desulfuromonadaceae bacterium]|nr:phage terminase large subunit [Desulfuromonadaceae bacterium]